jgi:serine/threonine-protein kinase/endoribonuclease IRE1
MDRETAPTLCELESNAEDIVGKDWLKNSLDRNLVDNLGKYRKYDAGSVRDLLRVIRNKVDICTALLD